MLRWTRRNNKTKPTWGKEYLIQGKYRNDGMNNDSTIQINWYLPMLRLNPETEPKPNLRVD